VARHFTVFPTESSFAIAGTRRSVRVVWIRHSLLEAFELNPDQKGDIELNSIQDLGQDDHDDRHTREIDPGG
jgi:hypothetical protein